ncbi:MAG TPA: hydroxymethylbilane synthase [Tepidisphaeraceae bacterium]|jgi:hydroxymethylbilane synthase|nr:hydroxymethylbilane synthase [Tepidisphaeraceae bacterium]
MTQSDLSILRLGTRGSMLARAQSGMVASLLEERHPGLKVELILIKTSGDRITDKPLHEFGGKGLFTKELEQALLAREVDFAVHSFKDVPVTMPLVDQSDLVIASVPPREDPRDVIVSAGGRSLRDLPPGSRVGTGSLRRRAQLLSRRADLRIEPIRGNIDTRLRKRESGEYDAVILAFAGLKRAGLFDSQVMAVIESDELLPAPGQGALALQCRKEDAGTRELLRALHDERTGACVEAERELVRLLEGDCHSPIAALAEVLEDGLFLRAAVGTRDGSPPVVTASEFQSSNDPMKLAGDVFEKLEFQGAAKLLHGTHLKPGGGSDD